VLRLVSATANPHKLDEIRELLAGVAVIDPRPADLGDVVEDAPTLAGNAELKVTAVVAASGAAAVADDTGLEVDALGGAPGVQSARYAGVPPSDIANVVKLLEELFTAGAHDLAARRARFTTVAVVGWPDGRRLVAEGVVEGAIAIVPSGTGGFGYDPVFIPDEGDGRTFAEMDASEKHALSHRGRAFRALAAKLDALADEPGRARVDDPADDGGAR
jgi:XTP/dITP diphosphohydrolase